MRDILTTSKSKGNRFAKILWFPHIMLDCWNGRMTAECKKTENDDRKWELWDGEKHYAQSAQKMIKIEFRQNGNIFGNCIILIGQIKNGTGTN